MRYKVAKLINIPPNSKVLDVLVGYANFSRAIAKVHNTNLIAIEITDVDIKEAIKKTKEEGLQDKVKIIKMDATKMEFPDETFDFVVNSIGWEDLAAISGREGIEKVFSEMVRVLKKGGILLITFIPEIEVNDEISKMDKELLDFIWKSKKRPVFQRKLFLGIIQKIQYQTFKEFKLEKSRIKPAYGYLKWFHDNYKSFYAPDVEMRSLDEIFNKFGDFIRKYGIREMCSHVIALVGKKK